jgi:TMEM175 potassium channel family protein
MTDEADPRHGPNPADARLPGRQWIARSGFIEYDRVVFFSDAIFAIAITLLAINLRVPVGHAFGSAHELHRALPSIRGFWISFAVIALFWIGHHGIFRYVVAADRVLILLNLIFLGTIAFLPYPTELLSAEASQTASVVFYAACAGVAGLAEAAVWIYAAYGGAKLTDDSARAVRGFYLLRIARIPVIFTVSIPIAFVNPSIALWSWLAIWLLGVAANRFGPALASPDQLD